ncbi:RNA polymerase sigma factor [Ktedonospora formicarum]|uniref:Uncharacterized protein n=1 Tax=Ktedonospora formicarum TaxID=2778364 RepID=A0A8J3I348_9CHLR|nr:sigma-70 family RNA polymerase sigma factor [Ktedonospora formicarum]GHO44004.1 hypothetical protein KSX_21670 [Ktedonospora formicarum]
MMQLPQHPPTADQARVAQLYQRYGLLILAAIHQRIDNKEDAEDILLSVFVVALETPALMDLEEPRQVAWLRRVAHNKCMDFYHRSARSQITSLEQGHVTLYEDERQQPENFALRSEELAQLRAHIATLPEHQQELILLRFGAGMRCTEIAQRMRKSEGAIRTLLSRTLNLLRNIYSQSNQQHVGRGHDA